ncbi:cation diffusion facilitator family transporter [Nitratifractor sp.]|uniref:cation diffusion facilitator family transporter n=1 Tax=Nitratifractor sp. TaxID=2268144 RepID=UPI0025E06FCD|nr:cation diffusion facilitator family transporter [Nitratifractor sp.]
MTTSRKQGKDEKKNWLLASTFLNAALAAAKLAWGWAMGSTLLIADGIHSTSDVFGALLIFLALFFANHRSKRFPNGMHKLEDMAAVLGGLGILYAGYEIIHSVFFEAGIRTPGNVWPTVAFILALLLIQALFYFFELRAAQRLGSPGVRADAINWLGDIGSGLIVVIGLVAHQYRIPYAQEVAVVFIVLMIFKGAFDVLREGLLSLLDAADTEIYDKVRKIVMSEPDITGIKRLYVRKSGSVYFADIEVKVAEVNAVKAHQSIDEVVQRLHAELPSLESVTIHYEPDHPPYLTVVRLLGPDKKTLSREFGRADWLEIEHWKEGRELLGRKIVQNPARKATKGKSFRLLGYLLSIHTDRIIMGPTKLDENVRELFDALDIEIVLKKDDL